MSLIWPTHVSQEPSGVARVGRVLHWLGVAAALLVLAGAGAIFYAASGDPGQGSWMIFGYCAAFAAAIYLLCRGARYVLAGE